MFNAFPFNRFVSFYNIYHDRKGTLSAIPKTGGCSVKGLKIPRHSLPRPAAIAPFATLPISQYQV
jgi:hypothetical protein